MCVVCILVYVDNVPFHILQKWTYSNKDDKLAKGWNFTVNGDGFLV